MTDPVSHGKSPVPLSPPIAGVILCGGESRRMGRSKALLPFAGRPMLEHVVSRIAAVARPIAVVAAPGQPLPPLPPDIRIVYDAVARQGPLEGIRRGLEGVEPDADAAFVASCDAPLIRCEFIRELYRYLEPADDAVVPVEGRRQHVLTAFYRPALHRRIEALQREGKCRPRDLLDAVRTRRVPADDLRPVDPHLDSLANANTPDELRALEQRAS